MGAQQSKPKQRSPNIKTLKQTTDNKKTTHTTPPIPNTKISLPPTNLQTPPLSPVTTTPTTPPATITTTTTDNDNNNIKEQNMDDGHQITNTILNRFVEPPSLSINDYLDQHSATDFFVQDSPDFYDVQSTISSNYSQYTALFSNLSSSIASSSISSVSSLQPKLKSTLSSSNIQQWNEPTPATTTLVQDLANIKTMDDLLLFAEKNQHIELAYFVAVCYHNGGFNNNQIDIIKSIQWFEKAALLGDKMLKNNNEKENKSIYLPLIAKAQYRVGKLLLSHHHRDHHNEEEENQKKAWQYIEIAAINENNKAEYLMGWKADKYENNFEKAIHWYISSWQHGLLEAQTALSCLLINHAHRLDDLTMNSIPGFTSDMSRDQLALSLLQDAADKNETDAILRLGHLYLEGKLVEKNVTLAVAYFDKTFELINEDAPNFQVIHYIIGREYRYLEVNRGFDSSLMTTEDGNIHYHQKAMEHFNMSVKSKYALAQRSLAHMLFVDSNPDVSVRLINRQKAFDLFHQAAKQDDITSMGFLGDIYEHGIGGMKPDWKKATYYYEKATKAGSPAGEYAWARLLLQQGLTKKAYHHFNHVLEQSILISSNTNETNFKLYGQNWYQIKLEHELQKIHCKAKLMIARYKMNGWEGCTKDPKQAFQDFIYLADVEHYGPAYYWLGKSYKDGITYEEEEEEKERNPITIHDNIGEDKKNNSGDDQTCQLKKEMTILVQPDLMRAYIYFEKGATLNNDPDCQLALARMCVNGFKYQNENGAMKTFQDHTSGLHWYEMAAQHGNEEALYSIGLFYENGLPPCTSKDLKKAEEYYESAAKCGYTRAMVQLGQLILKELNKSLLKKNMDNNSNSYKNNPTFIQYSKMALYWLSLAASKNSIDAFLELASLYELNCHPDPSLDDYTRYTKGFTYLNHPLLVNHPQTWCAKSRYYEHGWSVKQDLNESLNCLKKAESLNYSKAGILIGEFLERHGKTDLALVKYKELIKNYPLRSKVGWYARLSFCRIIVPLTSGLQSDTHRDIKLDLQLESKSVFQWLVDMADENLNENAIEPLFLYAWCYECGIGVTENLTKAKLHYEKAIKITNNNDDIHWPQQNAYFRLAKLCVSQQLYEESFKYFKLLEPKLDLMNHYSPETRRQAREIRYYLGYLLLHGYGTTKNEKEGIRWLINAADEGYGEACYILGLLYLKTENGDEARKRFDQGVSTGHPGCMLELALLLEQDHQGDIAWEGHDTYDLLERARELGDPEAMVRIAIVKQYGLGTAYKKENPLASLRLYREAAQKGHPKAAVYAAIVYHEMKEYTLAVNWFKVQSESLISQVWLSFYQLKGVGGLAINPNLAFLQLLNVAKAYNYNDQKDIGDRNALGLAYLLIGRCYEEGEGTAKNDRQAMIYYDLAKQTCQDVEATYRLGALLYQQYENNNNNINHDQTIELQQKAFECFDTAASKGHLEAKYMVGVYHARGLGGMKKDKSAARVHLQKAINDGHTRALLDLGHLLWSMKEYNEALEKFKEASKLRVPEASYQLGIFYHHGEMGHRHQQQKHQHNDDMIVEQNYHKAFDYFMAASNQGHFTATMMVGTYYQEGYDAAFNPKDLNKALYYYELAYSRQKEHMVELAIGKVWYTLADQEVNDSQQANKYHQLAFDWFKKASPKINETEYHYPHLQSDQNMIVPLYEAQMMVAFYYLNGWGPILKDIEHGFELLLNAAENGYTDSFIEVAKCYEKGIGTKQNMVQAYRFWSYAADMNLVEAMDRLSTYHREGLGGLISDQTKADEWEKKANAFRNGDPERDSSICTTSSTATY